MLFSNQLLLTFYVFVLVEVKTAIPVVMGANIGTSVTNTIVALGQIKEKNEFRRAFGGATVHDMFNWLSVLILLPLEVVTGYLFWLSNIVIGDLETGNDFEVEILSFITDPFTKWVIQVGKPCSSDLRVCVYCECVDVYILTVLR